MRIFMTGAAIATILFGNSTLAEEGNPPVVAPKEILKEHTKAVWCVAYSPDGKFLASGGGNVAPGGNNPGELILRNSDTGKRLATLPNQGGRVRALAFSPDGKILAAGYEPENFINRGLTVLWNLPAKTLKDKISLEAYAIAFSSDGKLLVLGGVEPPPPQGGRPSGGLEVWDVKRSRRKVKLVGHTSAVAAVAISLDGRTIASASLDRAVILWDVETGKPRTKLEERAGAHPALAFSPDGATLAIATQPKTSEVADEVTVVDLKTMKTQATANIGNNINALAFSHDGKTLAVGTGWAGDGDVILLDPAGGKRIAMLRGHADVVKGVCFSPDDKTLISGSTDRTVIMWDVSPAGLNSIVRKTPESLPEKTTLPKPSSIKPPELPAGKSTPADPSAPKLPESVIKFQKSLENLRKLEAVRLERRLEKLQEAVRLGAKDAKNPKIPRNPIALEATALLGRLKTRLNTAKSDKPYIPCLSPKDFAVGQIGELDDDLLFSARKVEGGAPRVSVMFEELSYLTGQPGIWSRGTIVADSFYVRASFAADLKSPMRDYVRGSPDNQLLRSQVYEVVESKPRGAVTDYVLAPFNMDEVRAWLGEKGKRAKE